MATILFDRLISKQKQLSKQQQQLKPQQGARVKSAWALGVLCLLGVSPFAQAVEALKPFPLASIEMNKSLSLMEHRIATGRIQKKNSGSMPEHWLALPEGELKRTLYRVRSSRGTDQIYQHYRNQLKNSSNTVLFECSSRECGSSIDWANKVFKVSTLYGVDRKQHYLAVQRQEGDKTEFVSLYITERGTGRTYVYQESYRLPTANIAKQEDASLFEQLDRNGWITLPVSPDGSFEEGGFTQLQALATELNNTSDSYWLVAHRYGKGSDEALMERSEQAAEKLLQRIKNMGLEKDNIEIKGLGPFAPTEDSVNYGGRIELVRKKN